MIQRLQLTFREWPESRRLRRYLLAVAIAVAVFSWLGPFGTAARFGPGELVVYWAAAIVPNWLLAMIIFRVVFGNDWRELSTSEFLPAALVGALVGAVPGTGLILLLQAVMDQPIEPGLTWVYIYACVGSVYLLLALFSHRLIEAPLRAQDRAERSTGIRTGGSPDPATQFLSRLPAHLGTDLLHLQMQDHYIEVHTTLGSELILLRFRDALRELADVDGLQVHRSHWVARHAVVETIRRDGRVFLRLSNAVNVPVSRSFVPVLKAEGWL